MFVGACAGACCGSALESVCARGGIGTGLLGVFDSTGILCVCSMGVTCGRGGMGGGGGAASYAGGGGWIGVEGADDGWRPDTGLRGICFIVLESRVRKATV